MITFPAPSPTRSLEAAAECGQRSWMNPDASAESLVAEIRQLGLLFDAVAPRTEKRDSETGAFYSAISGRPPGSPTPLAPGTIVILPAIVRMPDGRLPLAVILPDPDSQTNAASLVAPFAGRHELRFRGDWPTGSMDHDLAVLCLWNTAQLPDALLHQLAVAGHLPAAAINDAGELWSLLDDNVTLPLRLVSRTGTENPGPLSSDWNHIDAELAIWNALTSTIIPGYNARPPLTASAPPSPMTDLSQRWTVNGGEFILHGQPDGIREGSLCLVFSLSTPDGSPPPEHCRIIALNGQAWTFKNARCTVPAPAVAAGFILEGPDGEIWRGDY